MNLTYATKGHDWIEDYPGFPTIGVHTKIFVCQRCGKVRIEGPPHPKLKSRLGGAVHRQHMEMCRPKEEL